MGKEASTACNYKPASAFPNGTSQAAGGPDRVGLSSEGKAVLQPAGLSSMFPAMTDAG